MTTEDFKSSCKECFIFIKEIDSLKKEIEEQARLLGSGGSRELKLKTENDLLVNSNRYLEAELSKEKMKNHSVALKDCRELYEELKAEKIKYEEKALAYREVASRHYGGKWLDKYKSLDSEVDRLIEEQRRAL